MAMVIQRIPLSSCLDEVVYTPTVGHVDQCLCIGSDLLSMRRLERKDVRSQCDATETICSSKLPGPAYGMIHKSVPQIDGFPIEVSPCFGFGGTHIPSSIYMDEQGHHPIRQIRLFLA